MDFIRPTRRRIGNGRAACAAEKPFLPRRAFIDSRLGTGPRPRPIRHTDKRRKRAGGLAAAALGDDDLLNIMITIGLGWAAFAIIICGSWVLNSLNLYSTMLSVESTASGLNNKVVVAVLGGLGTTAAFLNILDHFLTFLFYLAIVFVPVAGVIAVDYLFLRRSAYHDDRLELQSKVRAKAIFAWALGACVALLGSAGWVQISSVAAIDAMLVAALAHYLLARFGSEHSSHTVARVNR